MRRVMKIDKDIEHVDPYVKDFDRRFRAMGSSGVRKKNNIMTRCPENNFFINSDKFIQNHRCYVLRYHDNFEAVVT